MTEGMNCFGRLLDLMDEYDLKDYSGRAVWRNTPEMYRLHEILEDEISERKIDV